VGARLSIQSLSKKLARIVASKSLGSSQEQSAAEWLLSKAKSGNQEWRHQVHAFLFLADGRTRADILGQLSNASWEVRHEVLTRFEWCRQQREAMSRGKSFNRPFRGVVGPSNHRKTLDIEFHVLLRFLQHYQKATENELLLSLYRGNTGEGPDFDVEDADGQVLGIEITQAFLSETSARERKDREKFKKGLRAALSDLSIQIWRRPSWSCLSKNVEKIVAALKDRTNQATQSTPGATFQRFFPEMGLKVCVKPKEGPLRIFDLSGPDGDARGFAGLEVEEKLAKRVQGAIEKKLSGPAPVTKPCILVIYNNTGLPDPDFEVVSALVKKPPAVPSTSHFKEIWFVDEQRAHALFSEPPV
jgi:hypothetical protein